MASYIYGIRYNNAPKTHIIARPESRDGYLYVAYCGIGVNDMAAPLHYIEPRERICKRCANGAARAMTIDGSVDRLTMTYIYDQWAIDRIDGTPLRPLAWAS